MTLYVCMCHFSLDDLAGKTGGQTLGTLCPKCLRDQESVKIAYLLYCRMTCIYPIELYYAVGKNRLRCG